MYTVDIEYSPWMVIWIEHFLKHATLIDSLPIGWCVYREALDWD